MRLMPVPNRASSIVNAIVRSRVNIEYAKFNIGYAHSGVTAAAAAVHSSATAERAARHSVI